MPGKRTDENGALRNGKGNARGCGWLVGREKGWRAQQWARIEAVHSRIAQDMDVDVEALEQLSFVVIFIKTIEWMSVGCCPWMGEWQDRMLCFFGGHCMYATRAVCFAPKVLLP